jgi:hypothetical protein
MVSNDFDVSQHMRDSNPRANLSYGLPVAPFPAALTAFNHLNFKYLCFINCVTKVV